MNGEVTTPPATTTEIASPEQLAAAREARGWSMSDVASKLGMMPRQIDAIEHGRWEALPGNAFVRGAIRAYGKALQLDVAPLLATLGSRSGAPELKPSASLDSPLPRHGALGFDNGGSGSRIVWIVLGVIGVIAIAMYFGRGADFGRVLEPGSGSSSPSGKAVDVVPVTPAPGGSALEPTRGPVAPAGSGASASTAPGVSPAAGTTGSAGPASAAPGSGAAAPGADASPAAGASAPVGAGDSLSPSTPPGVAPSSGAAAAAGAVSAAAAAAAADSAPAGAASHDAVASTTPAAPAAPSAPAASGDALVLRFERESWVDVRDASGKVLLMGTQPANSTRELSGQKPYSLTIGNATFVRVEHGGRSVDLGAVTQKGVARVRVE